MTNICLDCGKCCLETEMILSQEDVTRIMRSFKGEMKQDDFCFVGRDGWLQLRNQDHHCYFYDLISKKCHIYDIRPQGCRFYPLIYDIDNHKCTLDDDCPKSSLLYPDKKKRKKTCLDIIKYLKNQLKIEI
jgi:Fe-S-cluster containining protein